MSGDSFQIMPETCPTLEGILDRLQIDIEYSLNSAIEKSLRNSIDVARAKIVNEITLEFRAKLDDLVQENDHLLLYLASPLQTTNLRSESLA